MSYATNWNQIEDPVDLDVWNRMTANFWLPEKIALSNDKESWSKLSDAERDLTMKIFAGLTALDTVQGTIGAPTLIESAFTDHEKANLTFISAMESIHARSYSSIFSTLANSDQINDVFDWVKTNHAMKAKILVFENAYFGFPINNLDCPSDKVPSSEDFFDQKYYSAAIVKAYSVLLESFLFYSGFFLPLHFSSRGILTNTADIIRLILRDEGVHGYYVGYKFQKTVEKCLPHTQDKIKNDIYDLAMELYECEVEWTRKMYAEVGMVEDVTQFLGYNLNKAMNNLGYDQIIPDEKSNPPATILAQMTLDTSESHDFFSGSGSSYVMATAEETSDDDWG